MKHYKDLIVHWAHLVRHLKGQQAPADNKALSSVKLPFAAARTAARALSRKTIVTEEGDEDDFPSSFMLGGDASESAGGSLGDLGLGFGGEDADLEQFMESFEQCGIDMEEMTSKAMGAYLLYGSDIDPMHPDLEGLAPMLLALKDDDEEDCTDQELAAMTSAVDGFAECSGMSEYVDLAELESSDLFESIEDACKPVFDAVTSADALTLELGFEDEDSELSKSGKVCLQTLFGDNAIGNLMRYQWNHMDKTFHCYTKLSEDIPHCVLNKPIQEEGGGTFPMPLSLEEKLTCVVGSSADSIIKEMCTGIYDELVGCLPAGMKDANTIPASCGEDDFLLGMDLSVLSGNKIPAFCSKVFEETDGFDETILQRYDYYNAHRKYGWTIDQDSSATEATNTQKPEVDTKEDEAPQEAPQQPEPEAVYESNPVDIASVESTRWDDGEAETDSLDTKSKFSLFLVAGVAMLGAVVAGLLVKYRKHGTVAPSRKTYSPDLTFVEEPDIV